MEIVEKENLSLFNDQDQITSQQGNQSVVLDLT